ncbi:MAG TPA: hypothetical protein DEG43_11615 [Acidimicrobiaceae bacterium]|nr:hypothetical protein [Acidimicrobiaceae bacterium]
MACEKWIEAISAAADGEDPGVAPSLLEAHLKTCSACREFSNHVGSFAPPGRISASPQMPDLSRTVTKLNAIADRAQHLLGIRLLLGIISVLIAAQSAPSLLLGHDDHGSSHDARHLGAFTVAFAVGLLVVAVRPARARTMLPVAIVVAASLAVTAVIDIAEGHIPLLNEATHLPELISVALIWLLARPTPAQPAATEYTDPGLRLVEADDQRSRT